MLKEKTTITSPEIDPARNHVKELFEELDLGVEQIAPNIMRKLLLLNERTETLKDEERSVNIARAFFRYYENKFPNQKFTDEEQKTAAKLQRNSHF